MTDHSKSLEITPFNGSHSAGLHGCKQAQKIFATVSPGDYIKRYKKSRFVYQYLALSRIRYKLEPSAELGVKLRINSLRLLVP